MDCAITMSLTARHCRLCLFVRLRDLLNALLFFNQQIMLAAGRRRTPALLSVISSSVNIYIYFSDK